MRLCICQKAQDFTVLRTNLIYYNFQKSFRRWKDDRRHANMTKEPKYITNVSMTSLKGKGEKLLN